MVIDPALKLAISLKQGKPGVYALLLGSGVSSAAGIQTGWGITLDLVQKLGIAEGMDALPSPEEWYRAKYGTEPEYDVLLDNLTQTASERQALLRPYFEPTEEERIEGRKQPTQTHRAIARLVKGGYVRVIISTNFDRLMELALRDEGIDPDVISGDDTLIGSMPYVHSACTVIKLHGDYLDTRIKNTPEELASYTDAMNALLDRILDEFGLIVCGWSGVWDAALKSAILRCPNRRFSTYWLARDGRVDPLAAGIISHRSAEVVSIDSADGFFNSLDDKVTALTELQLVNPQSVAVAVATVKRYIPDPQQSIRLHDLYDAEVQRIRAALGSERFNLSAPVTQAVFSSRLPQYDTISQPLVSMAAALSYHGEAHVGTLLTRCLSGLTNADVFSGSVWQRMSNYPALLVLYSAGIGALANRHFNNLAAVVNAPSVRDTRQEKDYFVADRLSAVSMFSHFTPNEGSPVSPANTWPPLSSSQTPGSEHLLATLRPTLEPYFADGRYSLTFDLFEYILALSVLDKRDNLENPWSPWGRFKWQYFSYSHFYGDWENSFTNTFLKHQLQQGERAELLQVGFFGGSLQRFQDVLHAQEIWLSR